MDVRRNVKTPALARALLHAVVPPRHREFVLGDLEEQFHEHVDSHLGRRGARAWYWRQVWRCVRQRKISSRTRFPQPPRKGAGRMAPFRQDIAYAIRTLQRDRLFTGVVVLTLALGIGANTAIFSVADAVLLRTLPVPEPDRLVNLMVEFEGGLDPSFNYPLYTDYRDRNDVFTGLAAYNLTLLHLSTSRESERIHGLQVSANYFDVLGVRPTLGRGFLPEEDRPGAASAVAVIGHDLWRSRFNGTRDVLNAEILLNGHRFTIIGVAPPGFTGNFRGLQAHVFIPITLYRVASPGEDDRSILKRTWTWMQIVGRLKPGVTREQAQERMRALSAQIREAEPVNTHTALVLTDASGGYTSAVADLERPLILLQMIVALVLLIASANVANLLIARAVARRREMAVRLALGAAPGRLIRQLLTESTLLGVAGGAAGLLVAVWLAGALRTFRPTLDLSPAIDARVLLFAVGVTLATALLFGLAPALQASRPGVAAALKEEPCMWRGRRWNLRSALVVTQIGLSVVVLVAAGLAVKSLRALHGIDSGLDTSRVMLFALDAARSGYDEARGRRLFDELIERVRGLPGVQAAGLAAIRPLTGTGWRWTSVPEGHVFDENRPINLSLNAVTPGYLAAMGSPVLRGRDFTPLDTPSSLLVGIVNETLVKQYWPGHDGIGKYIQLGADPTTARVVEVVGVTRDSKYRALTETVPATLYVPLAQHYESSLTLVVRAERPATTVGPVRGAIRSLDATLPVFAVRSLSEQMDLSIGTPRMAAWLLSLFGGVALLLGVVGLYGVMAWIVARRSHEIGVRMALGAGRGHIFRAVVSPGFRMITLGIALGLSAALTAAGMMEDLVYDVPTRDPETFVGVSIALVLAALAACCVPARRAMRTDPASILRYE